MAINRNDVVPQLSQVLQPASLDKLKAETTEMKLVSNLDQFSLYPVHGVGDLRCNCRLLFLFLTKKGLAPDPHQTVKEEPPEPELRMLRDRDTFKPRRTKREKSGDDDLPPDEDGRESHKKDSFVPSKDKETEEEVIKKPKMEAYSKEDKLLLIAEVGEQSCPRVMPRVKRKVKREIKEELKSDPSPWGSVERGKEELVKGAKLEEDKIISGKSR